MPGVNGTASSVGEGLPPTLNPELEVEGFGSTVVGQQGFLGLGSKFWYNGSNWYYSNIHIYHAVGSSIKYILNLAAHTWAYSKQGGLVSQWV